MDEYRCAEGCKKQLYGQVEYCPWCGRKLGRITPAPQNPPKQSTIAQKPQPQPKLQVSTPVQVSPESEIGAARAARNKAPVVRDLEVVKAAPKESIARELKKELVREPVAREEAAVLPPTPEDSSTKYLVIGIGLVIAIMIAVMMSGSKEPKTTVANTEPEKSKATAKAKVTSPQKEKPAVEVRIDYALAEKAVREMLAAQSANDDIRFSDSKGNLDRLLKPPHQNRKAAREFNVEGLRLLFRNEFVPATQQFQLGTEADPGDVELRANLGFAKLKAGDGVGAIRAVIGALALSSDRVASWTALGQSLAATGDEENAIAAFHVGLRFTGNKEKIAQQFRVLRDREQNEKVVAALTRFLAQIDASPNERASPMAEPVRSRAARPVQVDTPAPNSPVRTIAVPSQPPAVESGSKPFSNSVVSDILDDGETCMAAKKFDCAITNARSALRIEPGSSRAQGLKQRAESEQQKTLESISIK